MVSKMCAKVIIVPLTASEKFVFDNDHMHWRSVLTETVRCHFSGSYAASSSRSSGATAWPLGGGSSAYISSSSRDYETNSSWMPSMASSQPSTSQWQSSRASMFSDVYFSSTRAFLAFCTVPALLPFLKANMFQRITGRGPMALVSQVRTVPRMRSHMTNTTPTTNTADATDYVLSSKM